jgi:hypothetical protein
MADEADDDHQVEHRGDQQQRGNESQYQPSCLAALDFLSLEKLRAQGSSTCLTEVAKLAPNHQFGRALVHARGLSRGVQLRPD